jgi:tetratricopeptide (TPR) repeat protein
MMTFLSLVLHVGVSPFKTKARLEAEIIMLRHQLNVLRLGNALLSLGARDVGRESLEGAVSAFRLALEVWTREQAPLDLATTQMNLGNALMSMGEREVGTGHLEEAMSAYRLTLELVTRAARLGAGADESWHFPTWQARGWDETPRGGGAAQRRALLIRTREGTPFEWAISQKNLGIALTRLAEEDSISVEMASG